MRSLLFCPGHDTRKIDHARTTRADVTILDLEDAVAPDKKAEARAKAAAEIAGHGTRRRFHVRINGLDTDLAHDDLDAVVVPGLAGIWAPKVEQTNAVEQLDEAITTCERRQGMPTGGVALYLGLETAIGVWRVFELASASNRVAGVSPGTAEWGDLHAEMGGDWAPTSTGLQYVRSRVALGARAAGLRHVIDGSHTAIRDEAGVEASTEAARSLGFTGKKVIHPSHVDIVNRAFTVAPEEIARAERVVRAYEEATRSGTGAIAVDGRLVDAAMASTARAILARARLQGGDAS